MQGPSPAHTGRTQGPCSTPAGLAPRLAGCRPPSGCLGWRIPGLSALRPLGSPCPWDTAAGVGISAVLAAGPSFHRVRVDLKAPGVRPGTPGGAELALPQHEAGIGGQAGHIVGRAAAPPCPVTPRARNGSSSFHASWAWPCDRASEGTASPRQWEGPLGEVASGCPPSTLYS